MDLVVIGLLIWVLWLGLLVLGVITLGLAWTLMGLPGVVVPLAYHSLLISGPRAATLGMSLPAPESPFAGPPWAEVEGGRPTLFQAIIQTVMFYLSVVTTGSLVLVVALFNPRRRTVHDWLAGTVVVNDQSRMG
jgi:uncharacterized RDD family membrane protein YckC